MRDKSSTHTPGPWEFEKHPDRQAGWLITDPFGNTAVVFGEWERDEHLANARLIAAAPDLLAACEAAAAAHAGVESCDLPQWLEDIEAAVAKARGEGRDHEIPDSPHGPFGRCRKCGALFMDPEHQEGGGA